MQLLFIIEQSSSRIKTWTINHFLLKTENLIE